MECAEGNRALPLARHTPLVNLTRESDAPLEELEALGGGDKRGLVGRADANESYEKRGLLRQCGSWGSRNMGAWWNDTLLLDEEQEGNHGSFRTLEEAQPCL